MYNEKSGTFTLHCFRIQLNISLLHLKQKKLKVDII